MVEVELIFHSISSGERVYDEIKCWNIFDPEGWFAVCKEDKWYYINLKGETVLKISDR